MDKLVDILLKYVAAAMSLLLLIPNSYFVRENTEIEVNSFTVASDEIPEAFDGYKILQVSDLHNTEFGEDHSDITNKIKENDPDIIVVTGDLIDAKKTNIDLAVEFMEKAVEIAPVYFVIGNHEIRILDDCAVLKEKLSALGVTVLDNSFVSIIKDSQSINLIGIEDPMYYEKNDDEFYDEDIEITNNRLADLKAQTPGYTILLSHRPELFDIYVKNGIDLVFSGHAHGGQFVLPSIGGVYAPHQGLFPAYDTGLYEQDGTYMLVSRGLGNSIIPIRINNNPELITVTLERN